MNEDLTIPDGMDTGAVNLARSIRKQESGGDYEKYGDNNSSYGAYQWNNQPNGKSIPLKKGELPSNWIASAKEVGLDPNDFSPKNQDMVAYNKIKKLKDTGHNVLDIAAIWNGGDAKRQDPNYITPSGLPSQKKGVYDVPAYAQVVNNYYQDLKEKTQQTQETPETKPTEITGKESAGEAAINALKNLPSSAIEFGKGIASSMNPLQVGETASQIPGAFSELAKESGGVIPAIGKTLKEIPGALYEGLIPRGVRQVISGDIQGASKSFQEDPFGQTAPVVIGALGGAEAIDTATARNARANMADYVKNIQENVANKVPIPTTTGTNLGGILDTGISKLGKVVTKPVEYVAGKATGLAKEAGLSMASQLTTLPASGIIQALKDPASMSKLEMDNATRGGLAGELKLALDTRIEDLSDVGKGYDVIRNSKQIINVPDKFVENALASKGLKIKNGKVIADTNSITRNTSDLNAIQKFYQDWGTKKKLTSNEFLNMRSDLGELSKFDKLTGIGKTKAAETTGQYLYEKANSTMRDTQIQELKALDDSYAPETKFLKQAKKDYFDSEGNLKDGAANKIANAGNKAELLKRLENIMPGITKRIELLKVIEDIKHSQEGFKVGAYTRGGFVGGSLVSGNIPAIIGSILTSPGNALQILRAAGFVGTKVAPILEYLQALSGDIPKSVLKTGVVNQDASKSQYTGQLNRYKTLTNMQ